MWSSLVLESEQLAVGCCIQLKNNCSPSALPKRCVPTKIRRFIIILHKTVPLDFLALSRKLIDGTAQILRRQ